MPNVPTILVVAAGLGGVAFVPAVTVLRRFSGAVYFGGAVYFAVAIFNQLEALVVIVARTHISTLYPHGYRFAVWTRRTNRVTIWFAADSIAPLSTSCTADAGHEGPERTGVGRLCLRELRGLPVGLQRICWTT